MLTLYLLQTFFPLALVGWLALAPPSSRLGYWAQTIATVLGLLAISAVGLWMFPPWWTPYVLAVLIVAAVSSHVLWHQRTSNWPKSGAGWLASVGFIALGLFAAKQILCAVAVTKVPQGRSIELASPLGPGTYLVANGGAGTSTNAHAAWLDQSVVAHKPWWGVGHGVDLIEIDSWGLRARGLMPSDPSRYVIFGKPVVAPCAGEIVVAVDGLPDMLVPQVDAEHLAGNHVILKCAGVDVVLAHFRKGSLVVRRGQRLATGDAIAEVGNSGESSEPHLHIHAQLPGTAEAPISGAPIPIKIEGRYLVRNDRLVVHDRGELPT